MAVMRLSVYNEQEEPAYFVLCSFYVALFSLSIVLCAGPQLAERQSIKRSARVCVCEHIHSVILHIHIFSYVRMFVCAR